MLHPSASASTVHVVAPSLRITSAERTSSIQKDGQKIQQDACTFMLEGTDVTEEKNRCRGSL
jgi:hypothetical protein